MVLCRISSQSRRSKVRWWPWPYWPHLWENWRGEHKVAFNACRWNENFCRTGILAGKILGAGFWDNESMGGRRGGSAVSLQLACSMYCEDAEFRRLLPHFKIMILSIKHETLRSTLWLLFTNPANYCLLTAKHPLPRPTLQYTGLTLPSLHHISDCSHITRRFREEISTELSKNGFFEGQKQASLAGWFQSLTCIVLWTK